MLGSEPIADSALCDAVIPAAEAAPLVATSAALGGTFGTSQLGGVALQ